MSMSLAPGGWLLLRVIVFLFFDDKRGKSIDKQNKRRNEKEEDFPFHSSHELSTLMKFSCAFNVCLDTNYSFQDVWLERYNML